MKITMDISGEDVARWCDTFGTTKDEVAEDIRQYFRNELDAALESAAGPSNRLERIKP